MKISRRNILFATIVIAAGAAGAAGASLLTGSKTSSGALTVGGPAPAFDVIDATGKRRTLAEFSGKVVVLEWTSPSCPFVGAQYNSGGMQATQRWSAERGVVWLSVLSTHPKRSDYLTPAKAQAFNLERNAAPAALLMDDNGEMGRAYGARTTPHMFVIAKDGTLAYLGAIDDRPSFFKAQVAGAHNYVRAAIEDLLAGRKVSTPSTRPYGCSVGYEG